MYVFVAYIYIYILLFVCEDFRPCARLTEPAGSSTDPPKKMGIGKLAQNPNSGCKGMKWNDRSGQWDLVWWKGTWENTPPLEEVKGEQEFSPTCKSICYIMW